MSELIELSGGEMDDNLAAKFESITRTILSNQTDALNTLTTKVEKDIGQVWRQMGIMYGQMTNSINILEKVGSFILCYVYGYILLSASLGETPNRGVFFEEQQEPRQHG